MNMNEHIGQAMNASTATSTTSARPTADSSLRRMFRTFCRELRRAIELAGEPYKNGVYPPL
jgi:hypothetical protein